MTIGTQNLIAAAKAEGVQRFILMSALGTSETAAQTVPYFAAKRAEERDVAASGLEYTTFRPSFVFGATAVRCQRSSGRSSSRLS